MSVLLFGSAQGQISQRQSSASHLLDTKLLRVIKQANNEDWETVRQVLARGANPNARGAFGRTALMEAAGRYDRIAKLLLSQGARVNAVSQSGQTPLMCAALFGSTSSVDLLLAHGAKINVADKEGHTALFLAAINNRIEVVKLLLKHGANRNAKVSGRTALEIASDIGLTEMVTILKK
jgi:uncharacterized protein